MKVYPKTKLRIQDAQKYRSCYDSASWHQVNKGAHQHQHQHQQLLYLSEALHRTLSLLTVPLRKSNLFSFESFPFTIVVQGPFVIPFTIGPSMWKAHFKGPSVTSRFFSPSRNAPALTNKLPYARLDRELVHAWPSPLSLQSPACVLLFLFPRCVYFLHISTHSPSWPLKRRCFSTALPFGCMGRSRSRSRVKACTVIIVDHFRRLQ